MNKEMLIRLLPLALLIFVMYFLLIRPQKKKERELASMRASLKAGDSIITIGGIYGRIVKVKDDAVTIQVGADKLKMEIARWAISQVVSVKSAKGNSSNTPEYTRKPRRLKADDDIIDVEVEEVKKSPEVE